MFGLLKLFGWLAVIMTLLGLVGCSVHGKVGFGLVGGQVYVESDYNVDTYLTVLGYEIPKLIDLEFPPRGGKGKGGTTETTTTLPNDANTVVASNAPEEKPHNENDIESMTILSPDSALVSNEGVLKEKFIP